MIDFLRFYILDKERFDFEFQQLGEISLYNDLDIITGELKEFPKKGKYLNMNVRLTMDRTYVYGSVHKLYNLSNGMGLQNYNDFSFCDMSKTIIQLTDELGIEPTCTSITNLEYGYNLKVQVSPQTIINQCLLMYNYKNHSRKEGFKNKGDYKEFKTSDYSLKIYNKSKQYSRREHILRVEIKIIKKRVLQRIGIFSLSDLLEEKTHLGLFGFLMERFEKLMILDSEVLKNALTHANMNLLKNYTNPHYWNNLNQSCSSKKVYRTKKKCNEFIRNQNLDLTKIEIKNLIFQKYGELLSCISQNNNCQRVA